MMDPSIEFVALRWWYRWRPSSPASHVHFSNRLSSVAIRTSTIHLNREKLAAVVAWMTLVALLASHRSTVIVETAKHTMWRACLLATFSLVLVFWRSIFPFVNSFARNLQYICEWRRSDSQIMFALKENYFLVNDRFLGDCCSLFLFLLFLASLLCGFYKVSMTPIGLFFILFFIFRSIPFAQQHATVNGACAHILCKHYKIVLLFTNRSN